MKIKFPFIFVFLPFWQSGQNVSWCNKLVVITLFGIFHLNMVVRFVSCQPVNQIHLRTVHLYSIGAKKSVLQDKTKIIQGKCIPSGCESICLEIFVPYFETLFLKLWDLRGVIMSLNFSKYAHSKICPGDIPWSRVLATDSLRAYIK